MNETKPSPESIVALEIIGEDVSVSTIDAPLLLEIAASFFALVQGNAKDAEKDIILQGISITNKCVQVAAITNSPSVAQLFVQKTHMQISGELPAPRGLTDLARRAQNALRRAPGNWQIIYKAGQWSKPISIIPKKVRPMRELISLRATVNKVTGAPNPHVRLESHIEKRPFSLRINRDLAKRLGKVLLTEIDIQAKVQRSVDGSIESGRLTDFEPVDLAGDTITEWKDWYKKNASEWDAIADIEGELKARTN